MFKEKMHDGLKGGADGRDAVLTHAVSRIMLNNYIDNIQTSWVKEGTSMSQLLLACGANDFGGTLINESISTAAGATHGQIIKPSRIRALAREIGRIPAQRTTKYEIIKTYESEGGLDRLDMLDDTASFGSYQELIKMDRYRFKNSR